MDKEKLTFDAKIFERQKEQLNKMLQQLTVIAINSGKTSEINMKITVDIYENNDDTFEPRYEIKLGNKIKEDKDETKGIVGCNNQIFIDKDGNVFLEEINKQIEIGGKK